MRRTVLALAMVAIGITATVLGSYFYNGSLSPATTSPKPSVTQTNSGTVIRIPKGSSHTPTGYSTEYFQQNFPTGNYPYPVNIKVKIGVNNTIEWVNDDNEGHTVTALVLPTTASRFNSGLIMPGQTFTVTLTVTGVYRYTCAWHNWLAGQITVDPA